MRYWFVVICFFLCVEAADAKWKEFETKDEIKNADRYEKTQAQLNKQKNKMQHNLSDLTLEGDEFFGKN